ncbi:PP2C family protein-serine/threonine phosphatase [Streptomyces griseoincarnatus]
MEPLIGGDRYAVHDTSHGLRMVIGDVRGKGTQSATLVNTLLGVFHAAALQTPDLPSVVQAAEIQVRDLKAREADAPYEDFATAVFVEILPDRSAFRMANRGHPAPLLVHGGRVTTLEPKEPSLPPGLGDLAGPVVPVDRYDLPPGATLVLFTDGIIEARDRTGAFFDPVPPLTCPLPPDPGAVLDAMLTALFRHTDEFDDDAAALAVTRLPDGQGEGPAPPCGPDPGVAVLGRAHGQGVVHPDREAARPAADLQRVLAGLRRGQPDPQSAPVSGEGPVRARDGVAGTAADLGRLCLMGVRVDLLAVQNGGPFGG